MDIYNLLKKDLFESYPIGIPHIYRTYDGYKRFTSVKEKWILDLEDINSDIYRLYNFFDDFAIQQKMLFVLHYYSEVGFKFILETKKDNDFVQSMIVFISPIIKYFTVYIEDISIIRKLDVEENRENINRLFCYYLDSDSNLMSKEISQILIYKTKDIFKNYNFIDTIS